MPDLSASLRELIDGSVRSVDVDGIVRARRRRRRQRRVGSAAVVVVIAAVVTGGVLARPVHEPAVIVRGSSGVTKIPEADATRAALGELTIVSPGGGDSSQGGGVGPVNVTDPRSGMTHQVAFPVGGVTSTNYPFLVRGSNVVMSLNTIRGPYDPSIGTVYVAPSTFDQARAIGPASYMVASVDPSRVWLVSDNSTPDQRLNGAEYGSIRTVMEVSLDGSYRSATSPLTDLRSPLGAVVGGLLTARPAASESAPPIIEVWDQGANRVVRRLPVSGLVVASSTSYVAWTGSECDGVTACALHLTDVRTGASRSLMPPAGMPWSPSAVAFSPDGARVALVATPPPSREDIERNSLVVPPGTQAATVVIVDAATGGESSWRSTTWKGGPAPSWSPDGSLVFFVRDRVQVGYFNVAYANSPVRDVPVPDAGDYLVADQPDGAG